MTTHAAPAQPLELLTPPQLAREFRTTPQTIGVWYRKGIIPAAIACGRILRFDRQAVLAALAEQATNRRVQP